MQDDVQNKSTAPAATLRDLPTVNAALLGADDPHPVTILRAESRSPFVLVLDHAGREIPARLGDLGLPETERLRHIAWDIGVAGTGAGLSRLLEAATVAQRYSRLVIDCNRRPGHPTSIAPHSDCTHVPGNQGLVFFFIDSGLSEIFTPYHDGIAGLLDARRAAGLQTVLVALHSFTPRLRRADRPSAVPPVAAGSGDRPWHAGVLHHHDPRFAVLLRDLLRQEGDLVVGDNEPYALSDLDDYTVPVHGEQRGLPHVEIEIRQDLIADRAGESHWAARLGRLLPQAWLRYREAYPCP